MPSNPPVTLEVCQQFLDKGGDPQGYLGAPPSVHTAQDILNWRNGLAQAQQAIVNGLIWQWIQGG